VKIKENIPEDREQNENKRLGCLMTMATAQTTQHQMAGKMVNNELDSRMKEAVVA
jgi:hypothetical protein